MIWKKKSPLAFFLHEAIGGADDFHIYCVEIPKPFGTESHPRLTHGYLESLPVKTKHHVARILAASAITLFTASQADAATPIDAALIGQFQLNIPQTAPVQASAWFKSAFGNAGWTHFSKWGYINLKAGQKVTVSVQSTVPGLHPGLTCWHRALGGKNAPINYFTGHSYIQFNDVIVNNTTDETSGAKVGNFKMILAANGYDRDGMPQAASIPKNASLNPIEDGVPGLVSVSFRAKQKGTYMCVVGGINPDNNSSATGGFDNNMTRHNVTMTFSR